MELDPDCPCDADIEAPDTAVEAETFLAVHKTGRFTTGHDLIEAAME